MDNAPTDDHPTNSSSGYKLSAIESIGLCPSCRGSGHRPTTGVWVALDSVGISVAMQSTSPRGWSPWLKRVLLAFVASAFAAAGWSTWISVLGL